MKLKDRHGQFEQEATLEVLNFAYSRIRFAPIIHEMQNFQTVYGDATTEDWRLFLTETEMLMRDEAYCVYLSRAISGYAGPL